MNSGQRMPRRRQAGVSVVEIMISLALGLILMVGVTNMVMGSRRTSTTEQNLADMQATGRIALQLIAKELRRAGYRHNPEATLADAFPAEIQGGVAVEPFTTAGSVVGKPPHTANLVTRYQGSGESWDTDCLNQTIAAGQTVWTRLTLGSRTMYCNVRPSGGTQRGAEILRGIDAIFFSYGVDNDGDTFADEYKAPADVTDWTRIASVNVQVRVVSEEDFLADRPQPYVGFDGVVVTPTDRRLRRSYATVVAIRNVLP